MYRNIILGLFTLAAVLLCLCAAPANGAWNSAQPNPGAYLVSTGIVEFEEASGSPELP